MRKEKTSRAEQFIPYEAQRGFHEIIVSLTQDKNREKKEATDFPEPFWASDDQ